MAPQQDAFMDDSDDCCPLCVEEFDLSDRSFRPCPCGYQVCQFCYNNIKNNMNGLCPACRRPYDDKNIQWKVISPEEAKADVAAQARKKAAARQKEAERRQVETLNRKHLAGLRVVQKNLVYVVGMNITGSNDDILGTLRGPHHFGQYGEIIKIVVSKAKNENASGNQPLGIYVTFVNKEDAATCISALDGQVHEGRSLRAQYGTTKYCSAYLRNEKCNNRQCMFLHETGEDSDSFSRQDLSSFNALSTQRRSDSANTSSYYQAPPQQAPQNIAAAAPAASVKSDAMSRSDSGEGSALPTTANWAKNPQIEQSRRSSQAASRLSPSPIVTQAKPVMQRPESRAAQGSSTTDKGKGKEESTEKEISETSSQASQRKTTQPPGVLRLEEALKRVSECSFEWSLDRSLYDDETLAYMDNMPSFVDPNGGAIRYAMKLRQEQERAKQEEERAAQALAAVDEEENLTGGSLQLGGEPEDQPGQGRRQTSGQLRSGQGYDGHGSIGSDFAAMSLGSRSLTPQQQRNIAPLKGSPASDAFNGSVRAGNTSQHQSQLSNPFQAQNQQLNPLSRHGRQSSRYTFANDTASASTAVKPSTSAHLLAQQSAMMPPSQQKPYGTQPTLQPALYTNNYSNIQGPPPGLKPSGTPPISGGGMFGQGHGFASAMGGSLGYGMNPGMKGAGGNDDLVRDIIRGRGAGGGPHDNTKLDISDPSILQARMQHNGVGQGSYGGAQGQDSLLDDLPARPGLVGSGTSNSLYQQLIEKPAHGSRPGTPAFPPGLASSADFPPLTSSKDQSRPGSIAPGSPSLNHKLSIKPIVPVVPHLPERPSTPAQQKVSEKDETRGSHTTPGPNIVTSHGTELSHAPLPHAHELPQSFAKVSEKNITQPVSPTPENQTTPSDSRFSLPGLAQRSGESLETTTKPAGSKVLPPVSTTIPSAGNNISRKVNSTSLAGSSQPATPATPLSQPSPSPVVRQARTLRLIQTPKFEEHQASQSQPSPHQASAKQLSRQGSIASFHQPETPDNASVASTSASRAASPQRPSKVGAAPVRQKTKSQVKKDRQARAKAEEEKLVERQNSLAAEESAVQAPIVGRKKKAKKQRPMDNSQPKDASTSSSPRQTSPSVVDETANALSNTSDIPTTKQTDADKLPRDKITETSPPVTTARDNSEPAPEPQVKAPQTVSSIIAELKAEDHLSTADLESFLSFPSYNHRFDSTVFGALEHQPFPNVTEEQIRALEDNELVIVQINDQEWGIILPDRSTLRYLTKAEVERYVELRKSVNENDPDFLSSARLPSCGTLYTSWDDSAALGSPSIQESLFNDDNDRAMQLSLIGNRRSYEGPPSQDDYDQVQIPGNEGLAAEIENMTLEEAEVALKRSEDLIVGHARKDADAVEKKLNQLAKRNRKLLREQLGA